MLQPCIRFIHGTGGNKIKKALFLFVHISAFQNPASKFIKRALLDTIQSDRKGHPDRHNAVIKCVYLAAKIAVYCG